MDEWDVRLECLTLAQIAYDGDGIACAGASDILSRAASYAEFVMNGKVATAEVVPFVVAGDAVNAASETAQAVAGARPVEWPGWNEWPGVKPYSPWTSPIGR